MKIADRLHLQGSFDRETLSYLKQMGAEGVVINIASGLKDNIAGTSVGSAGLAERLLSGPYWTKEDLTELREIVESYGLVLDSIAHTPESRWRDIFMGGPRTDEQIDNWCQSLSAMQEAGIPVLQYWWTSNHGAPQKNWRTNVNVPLRGGARAESFDYELAKQTETQHQLTITDAQLWDNLAHFLRRVIPVAESVGVRMAMHPSDPQVAALNGVPRIMRTPAAFDRMLDIIPSPSNAINFCQGCFSQMLDAEGVYQMIRHFSGRNAIAFVHFRNVSAESVSEKFTEAFWDEGKVDMAKAMHTYHASGYTGFLTPDHHPHVIGDTLWGHRSRGFALGYMRGLVQSLRDA